MAIFWTMARRGKSPEEAFEERQRRMGKRPLKGNYCEAFESRAALANSYWMVSITMEDKNPASYWEVVRFQGEPRKRPKSAKRGDGVAIKIDSIEKRTPWLAWLRALETSADADEAAAAEDAIFAHEMGCEKRGEDPNAEPPLLEDEPEEPSFPFPYYNVEPTTWQGDRLHFRVLYKRFTSVELGREIEEAIVYYVSSWCPRHNLQFEWHDDLIEVWLEPPGGITADHVAEMKLVWTTMHADELLTPILQVEMLAVSPADDPWTKWTLKNFPEPKAPAED